MKIATLLLSVLLLSTPAISLAQQIAAGVYNVSIPFNGTTNAIAAAPDGALWFPQPPGKIGRITTAGAVTSFRIPNDPDGTPNGIAAGPDGAMWFTLTPDRIGRITTAGVVTLYRAPGKQDTPWGITAGPDGAMWFTQFYGNLVGRITTAGVITKYSLPTLNSDAYRITVGPDGALWFTEDGNNKIGRITTAGVATEYPLPTAWSNPWGITAGPDGAVWFTEIHANQIGRITTAGVLTEYPLPGGFAYDAPTGIAAGPDGALWFTPVCCGAIDRITTDGTFSWYPVANTSSALISITTGSDGEFWMSSNGGGQIGEAVFVTANLSVLPTGGNDGSSLTFTGSGFAAGERVQVYASGVGSAVLASGTADSSRAFTATGRVPQSAYGQRFFLGAGQRSGKLGAASFTIAPRLILNPQSGTPGATVSVSASGFGPFETVNIFWDNGSTALGSAATDVHGAFNGSATFTFTVPASASPGANTVTATGTDPAASASATYIVK